LAGESLGGSALASGAACQIAAALKEQKSSLAGEVLQTSIVLTTDLIWVQPLPGKVFLPGIVPAEGSPVSLVHPTVAGYSPFRKALEDLGIGSGVYAKLRTPNVAISVAFGDHIPLPVVTEGKRCDHLSSRCNQRRRTLADASRGAGNQWIIDTHSETLMLRL